MRAMKRWLLLCASASCLVTAGCADEFAPYWRIDKLRIMGVKSSPPTLKPFRTATLEVLTHDPAGRELSYQWEWCPFRTSPDSAFECPITYDELIEQLEANIPEDMPLPPGFDLRALIPDFDLGTEPTAELAYPATTDVVFGLCLALTGALAGGGEDLQNEVAVSDCERGFEVNIRVRVTPEGGGEAESLLASKRVNLWTGSEFDQNLNPDVTDISIRLAEPGDADKVRDVLPWVEQAEASEDRFYVLPADEVTPLVAGVPYEVRAELDPELIETFQRPAPEGLDIERLDPELEAITYRWFVSGGDLGNSSRVYKDGLNELDEASVSTFVVTYDPSPDDTALNMLEDGQDEDWDLDGVPNAQDNCPYLPSDSQADADGDGVGDACRVRIWAVARDGRLGVDWLERQVEFVDFAE